MLVVTVELVATLTDLAAVVFLEGGGEHNKDLLGGQERLGDGDGRARLARPQAVVQKNAAVGRLNHHVVANEFLVREEFALVGTRLSAVLQERSSNGICECLAIGENVIHCFSQGFDNGVPDTKKP